MAEPVYDDQKKENKKPDLTPEEIRDRENEVSKSYDHTIGGLLGYSRDERGDKHKDLREASQEQDVNEAEELQNALRDEFDKRLEEDKEAGLYNPDDKPKGIRGRVKNVSRRQKMIMGAAGGGIIGLVLSISALFGFLNNFRLDHLISSIDGVAFAKVNATFDRRSDRWLRTYVQLRLSELSGGITRDANGNYDMRSAGVDTDNPLTDWYRTLRSNRFEERMFNRQGIFFTSVVDTNGNVRYARITVNGHDTNSRILTGMTPEERNAYFRDPNNFDSLTREIFEGEGADKKMRKSIKESVVKEARFYQVLKRRHIRKDIQNKVGVRNWRFFEKTRDKTANAKRNFKRKMITSILPEDTKAGKFVVCMFGLGSCTDSTDHNHPDRKAGNALTGSGIDDNGERTTTDADGNTTTRPSGQAPTDSNNIIDETLDGMDSSNIDLPTDRNGKPKVSRFSAEFFGRILSKFNIILAPANAVDTLDVFHKIHKNIVTGKLSKMVVVAKGIQAAQAYTLYGIMRDQANAGDVDAQELGYVMQGIAGMSNSEGYDYFFKSSRAQTAVSAMADKETFCSEDYERQPNDYYYLCDEIKIGGKNGGDTVKDWYEGPAFIVIRSVMEIYDGLRNNPVTGFVISFLRGVADAINDIVNTILEPVLGALGITDRMQQLVAWMGNKFMVMLGAGPILSGDFEADPPGLTMNMIAQGAAYTAEMNMRSSGAPIENEETSAYINKITGEYLADQKANMSLYERYFALDNHQSLAATTLFSFINTPFSQSLSNISSTLFNSFGSILSIFGGRAAAASDSYGAADFAGIDEFAFPPECIENDPLTTEPADLTNADEKEYVEADEITWDFLRDEDTFWERLYEEAGEDEDRIDEVQEVYNCLTLDKRVRGSLGHTSGYKDDDGLEDGPSSDTSGANGPVTLLGDLAFPLAVRKSQLGNRGMFHDGDTDISGHPYTAYDIIVNQGTTVVSMTNGRVVRVSNDCSGNTAAITVNIPEQGISIWYGHLDPSSIMVDEGQQVTAGTPMARVVNSAVDCRSGADHLHIDASTNVGGSIFRPGCARTGCSAANAARFRSIGNQLYTLYEALPD